MRAEPPDWLVEVPPTAQAQRVRDVLIHTTDGEFSDADFRDHPPVGFRSPGIQLADDLRIDHLDSAEADLVMEACEPRGHRFEAARQFNQRYAFVREIELAAFEERTFAWDPGNRLFETVMLSRLIVENATSTAYAARIVTHAEGEPRVIPRRRSESDHVYRLPGDGRDWLDPQEATELRQLLEAFWADGDRPQRVKNSMWLSEYARQTYWIDQALPLTVTALEVLISTSREGVTRQFVERVPQLAAAVGIPDISKTLCRKAYDDRSHGVHRGRLPVTGEDGPTTALSRLRKLRRLLSAVERRCIEDAEFGERFRDDEAVADAWPIPPSRTRQVSIPLPLGLRLTLERLNGH